MMRGSVLAVVLVLVHAACGRIAFEPLFGADDAGVIGSRYCDSRPDVTFCDDFDDPAGPLGWRNSSSFAVRPLALSPPSAVRVFAPASTDGCIYVRLAKTFETSPIQRARLEFAFHVAPIGAAPGHWTLVQFLALGMPSVTNCSLLLNVAPGGSSLLHEQDAALAGGFLGKQTYLPTTLAADRYYTADLAMTFGSSPRATLLIDGAPAIDVAMEPDCAGSATMIETNMGLHCRPPTTADADIHFDNVAVTLSP